MLISPARIHSTLSSLLGNANAEASSSTRTPAGTHEGVHTALLITPQGQLISSANLPPSDADADEEDGGNENGQPDGVDVENEANGEEEDDEGPYLETQERRRLLLGLASQWDQSESSKMECELGKLHFTYIQLDYPSQPSSTSREHLPAVKPPFVDGFVLVLNGDKDVPWNVFSTKSEEFKKKWRD
ncbi:hypothetical protein IAT40_002064 [Kwoniella sp. CBS 6097]